MVPPKTLNSLNYIKNILLKNKKLFELFSIINLIFSQKNKNKIQIHKKTPYNLANKRLQKYKFKVKQYKIFLKVPLPKKK